MKTYSTSEIADYFKLHTNTIRLYEELVFIKKPERKLNGYRIYTDLHIEQMKLARLALKSEVLQNGLRKQAIDIIKTTARENYDDALFLSHQYLDKIRTEKQQAEDVIQIAENILYEMTAEEKALQMTRKQTADYLLVTIDTLRNWEMNGLLSVKRKENGYRVYNSEDIRTLKIIRTLRCANYSLTSILRLLNDLSGSNGINIKKIIDTPNESEDIVSVCDKLLTSLSLTELDAIKILEQIEFMKRKFSNHPV